MKGYILSISGSVVLIQGHDFNQYTCAICDLKSEVKAQIGDSVDFEISEASSDFVAIKVDVLRDSTNSGLVGTVKSFATSVLDKIKDMMDSYVSLAIIYVLILVIGFWLSS